MARVERMRELLAGPLDIEHVQEKTAAGWRLVGEDVPYGLRVASDCIGLEEDPMEKQVLMLMMELLVQDSPFSKVAYDLNQRDFRTRQGKLWSPVSVFNMLPRLIEVGPQMFSSHEWETRRQHFSKTL